MAEDFLKGYESTSMDDAEAPNRPSDDKNRPIGTMAINYKAHWKNKPQAFPWGSNDEGGK